MTNVNVRVNNRPTSNVVPSSIKMGVKANQSLKLIFLQGKADVSVIYNDREVTQPILGKDIDTEFDLLNQSVQGTPKEITYISVCNINATIAKVNVVIEDGVNTHYILKDIQIKQGETLEYYDTLGWSIKSNASMHIQTPIGIGDMYKAIYDVDDDGIVDNSMALDGHPASDFVIPTGAPTDYLDGEGNPQPFPSTSTTNLAYTASPTNGIVTSSTGTDATIPLADVTNAGLFAPAEKSKLSSITEIFTTALKTAYDSAVTWISTNGATLISHLSNTSNPHSVTKSQVGLGSVPNIDTTSAVANEHTHSNKVLLDSYTQTEVDLADAVSKKHTHSNISTLNAITEAFTTALKTSYDSTVTWISANGASLISHLSNTSNPHSVTKSQVGLGSVVNSDTTTTANITDSTNKRFVTDSQQIIIGNTSGTNSGDNAVNSLYSGLATSKEDTIASGTTSEYWRGDKTWQTLDKSAVGLGNVDNTSDVNKPVSTAQATAIGLKYDASNPSNFISDINALISQGTNVTITGSGTIVSPYVINASGGGGGGSTLTLQQSSLITTRNIQLQ